MDNYIQLHFSNLPVTAQEILIAQLENIGYEGFEQGKDFLNACIPEPLYDASVLRAIHDIEKFEVSVETITQKNWNEEWEKSFEPVIIENFCAIRASFHLPVPEVQHEIIITPKMSFGTGHHATTCQVIQLMKAVDFREKNVLDFGTGTGVLAILAEKLGARHILAIDNDDWSIENANENILANNCSNIKIQKEDQIRSEDRFDIILANINRRVILENLPAIAKHLHPKGVLIISGLLKDDQEQIAEAAFNQRLLVETHSQKYDWVAIRFAFVNSR